MNIKKQSTNFLILLWLLMLIVSCSEETDDPFYNLVPTELTANNTWLEDEVSENEIRWYKVSTDEKFNKMYVEWAELGNHGEKKSYSADIKVSAYMLDGETAYFENKNNGYGKNIRFFLLETETEILLKVELNNGTESGSFAIRATGTSVVEVEYNSLILEDSWKEQTIKNNETLGYLVDCGNTKKVAIIWTEADSPESGYTAEIIGSVFHSDGTTVYKDITNGKEILNKNKSHSNEPRIVELDANENQIKIHIQTNGNPGTFAIKVVSHTE